MPPSMLELVVVHLRARDSDPAVEARAPLERHAGGEERAVAALGELAGAHAEHGRIELRRAHRAQLIVQIRKGAVMAVLRLDAFESRGDADQAADVRGGHGVTISP